MFRARNRVAGGHRLGKRGVRGEAGFWDKWLTEHLDAGELRRRLDPAAPADPLLCAAADRFADARIEILDVGAGPLSTLGKRVPGKEIEIVAVDPLADEYTGSLERAGIEPPVVTVKGEAELLVDQFGTGRFHVAHASNALDHTYDPVAGIREMVEVVRPGGTVILRHGINEAEAQGYRGLHQWNFDRRDGAFWVWSASAEHNVSEMLRGRADVECREQDGWLVCVITLPSPSEPSRGA